MLGRASIEALYCSGRLCTAQEHRTLVENNSSGVAQSAHAPVLASYQCPCSTAGEEQVLKVPCFDSLIHATSLMQGMTEELSRFYVASIVLALEYLVRTGVIGRNNGGMRGPKR